MNSLNLYFSDVVKILSKKHKFKLVIFILLFLLSTMFEMIGIGFVIPVIEAISNYDNFSLRIKNLDFINIDNIDQNTIVKIVIGILLVIYTIKNIFLTILSYLQFKFLKNVKFELGNIAFNVYLKKNFFHHLNTNSSKIIRNINDTTFATEAVKNLMIIISEIFVVIGISIFLFIFQPVSTLIVYTRFPYVYFSIFFMKNQDCMVRVDLILRKKIEIYQRYFGSIKDIKIKKENFFLKI